MKTTTLFIIFWFWSVYIFSKIYSKKLERNDVGNLLGLEFTFYDCCPVHIIPTIFYSKSIPARKDGKYYKEDKKTLTYVGISFGQYRIYIKRSKYKSCK